MSFGVGYEPTPPADFNEDGSVTFYDAIMLLSFITTN